MVINLNPFSHLRIIFLDSDTFTRHAPMSVLHKLSAALTLILTRRVCARLLSTFICSVVIVIHPFSRFGGSYAFLVLTLKELVFGVQKNLAQQIEATGSLSLYSTSSLYA